MAGEQKLNPAQIEAVEHTEGPLLILAGAGSGKTRTLTHRIAHLIKDKNVPPMNILAVTFTNKAASEMRHRVAKLLGHAAEDRSWLPFLGTFHGICVKLLRREARTVGFSPNFVIFDEADSLSALKQAMRDLQINEKQYSPRLLKNLISAAKNELIDAETYQGLVSGPAQEVAAKVWPRYQAILKEANAFDFDDLLTETVAIFKKYPEVLSKWQIQFRYILIDEYQDTNHAQYQLVKLLAAAHKNICVVGDDWQSIYSWRGANFKNILDFEKDYPKAKVVKLEQNYRSTKQIVAAAQEVINKNQQRTKKDLWTDNIEGAKISVHQASSEIAEADLIVQAIESAVESGRNYSDFAVLYRTNAQSRSLEESFVRYGVPYKVIGGVRFYERREVKDVLAYLRFIFQPEDLISFNRIINLPPRGLGATSLGKFLAYKSQHKLSLLTALAKAKELTSITARASKSLSDFHELVQGLRGSRERLGLAELVELIIKRSGYLEYLNDGSVQAADRIENVQELVSVAKEYDQAEGGAEAFLEEVALISDIDNYDEHADAVTLMTLHAAKGLEFPVVFLAGMEEGVFPHSNSFMDPQQMEEERRLCYVGMTRAMEELHLVHATARLLYGRVMHNPPARFIAEVSDYSEILYRPASSRPLPQDDFSQAATAIELAAGDSVRHPAFGTGKVLEIDDDEATIEFGKIGSKRLSLAYAPLEKI